MNFPIETVTEITDDDERTVTVGIYWAHLRAEPTIRIGVFDSDVRTHPTASNRGAACICRRSCGARCNDAPGLQVWVTIRVQGPAGTSLCSTNRQSTRSFWSSSWLKPRQPLRAGETSRPAPLNRVFFGRAVPKT